MQQRVLDRAPQQTLAQLKAALKRAVVHADPDGAAERHKAARRDRRVAVGEEQEGMASLWALLTATDARSCFQWLTRLAQGHGKDDPRGMDARRADLLVELLTGALTWAPADDPPDTGTDAESGTSSASNGLASDCIASDGGDPDGRDPDGGDPDGGDPDGRDPDGGDPDGGDSHGNAGCGADSDADGQTTSHHEEHTATGTDTGTGTGSEDDSGDGAEADTEGEAAAAGDAASAASSAGTVAGRAGLLPQPVNPGKPLVQVLMPFTTLLGIDQQPCELVGHGPIPAELVREIATDATLKRLVYDPLSGTVLDHGRTTYRPPAGLADHVRARDVHCRGPICRRRVLDGHLDHVVPFPDGPTNDTNLHGCCGHDHRMKHAPGWAVRALPDGRIQWATPTGHRYHSHPHDYRPEPDPPPTVAQEPDEPEPTPPPRWSQQDYDRVLSRRPDDAAVPDDEDPPPF